MKHLAKATDYTRTRRPVPVAVFNSIGRSLRRVGFSKPLDAESLLRHGRSKCRSQGVVPFEFEEAFNTLVDSINREARLSSIGLAIQRMRLANALANHFKVTEFLASNPRVNEVDLGKIVLIAGLQRTGTTLLQRLLASHSQIRGISPTSAMNPVATTNPGLRERLAPYMAERTVSYLAPHFKAIHPVDTSAPEEDVLLLDLCFMSQTPEATMHVPRYSTWLEEQDHTGAYEFFAKLLKIRCLLEPSRVWVLKSPHHLEYLDTFLSIFPSATVIQTHRDPLKTIPSFSSMVCHARSIFSDHVDPTEVSEHWFRKVERMARRSMCIRAALNEENFVDVQYHELIDDPVGILSKICSDAGIEFTKKDEDNAQECLRLNRKDRFGEHVYDTTDFGLDREMIEGRLGFYREHYAIPYE